jgi:carboxypeptidase C (cathepsin A)
LFRRFIATALVLCATTVFAEEKKDAPAAKEPPKDNVSSTQHSIHIGSETINYTARAGTIVMKDEDGNAKANVFFVA